MTDKEINQKIKDLLTDFDEEVIGTTFIPKEQAKRIMIRKMVLLTELITKEKNGRRKNSLSNIF